MEEYNMSLDKGLANLGEEDPMVIRVKAIKT